MREILSSQIAQAVCGLFLTANYDIGSDISASVDAACASEPSPVGRAALHQLSENYRIASQERVAICQDTGMSIVFAQIGQEVHIAGGLFEDAVNAGVRKAYETGYLRKSVVAEPLFDRVNTGDNTPAVLHTSIVQGDRIRLLAVAKGFGSENMSRIAMLAPSQGAEGVKEFVAETVSLAGPNACPPLIVGVGIGGTMEQAAIVSKMCTVRPLDSRHPDPRYAALEDELLQKINRLGIGPAGTGGRTTALKVNVDYRPTHIAGLPVAVNICCHAARHAETVI